MKNPKKLPTKQVEQYSALFMQLGLVLTLFIVFLALEHQSVVEKTVYIPPTIEKQDIYTMDRPIIFKKEVVTKKKRVSKLMKQVANLTVIQKTTNETKVPETVIDKSNTITIPVLDNSIIEEKEDEEINKEDEPHSLFAIQEAPIFKGCEGLDKVANKKCFEKKLRRFVLNNFNGALAEEVELYSGKHRIATQFVINEKGTIVDVKIRAPHKVLEKETQRIVNRIPKFIPGKQNGKPVKVKYTLPITFEVE